MDSSLRIYSSWSSSTSRASRAASCPYMISATRPLTVTGTCGEVIGDTAVEDEAGAGAAAAAAVELVMAGVLSAGVDDTF